MGRGGVTNDGRMAETAPYWRVMGDTLGSITVSSG